MASDETPAARPARTGKRAQIAEVYDTFLAELEIGDSAEAQLSEGENRELVRQRLQKAARRRELRLVFIRTSADSSLRFRVVALDDESEHTDESAEEAQA